MITFYWFFPLKFSKLVKRGDIYLTAHHLVIFLYPFDFMIKIPIDIYYDTIKFIYENRYYVLSASIIAGTVFQVAAVYMMAKDAHKKFNGRRNKTKD